MSGNTILIVLILIILLVLLAIFSRCNKWINHIENNTTRTIDNVHTFGRDNICKTAPSTPSTPKIPQTPKNSINPSIVLDLNPQEIQQISPVEIV